MSFFEIDFQFLLLTIFNLQANILTTKDILSNLDCGQRSNGAVFVLYFGIRATNKKLPLNYGHRAIFCGWAFLNVSSFYSHFINICGPVLFLVHLSLRNISSQKDAILTFCTAIAAFLFYAKQSQCIYNSKKIQFLLIYIYGY